MHHKPYILYLSIFLFSFHISSAQEVGDIPFNKAMDDSSFYQCYMNWVPQYYGVETTYLGGTDAINKIFSSRYNSKGVKNLQTQTGYITIRFIVNCRSATGRFRIYQVDSSYQTYSFDPTISKRLLEITKSLSNWIPGTYKDMKVDSYYYLTFKIIRGELKEITPWKPLYFFSSS